MSAHALHAARVLTPKGFEPDACVLVDGARILSVMPSSSKRKCRVGSAYGE